MIILPFQINNFRIPVNLQYPTFDFGEGIAIGEHAFINGGKVLKGRARISTQRFNINSYYCNNGNSCYQNCQQYDIDEFYCKLISLTGKEVEILFIGQNNKIYKGKAYINQRIQRQDVGCDCFLFTLSCTLLNLMEDCTNDIYLDTPCEDCFCSEWYKINGLKFCDIDKDCRVYKTFFRPDFVPTSPGYFPKLRGPLVFLNGQMVVLNSDSLLFKDNFKNPYPEINNSEFVIPPCCNCKNELYYFFDNAPPGMTSRTLYLNNKVINIPIDKPMLAIANGKIFAGNTYSNLKEIDKFDNQFYDERLEITYANNLNIKDYYAYYKQISILI
jgi:hypothetical protein